MQNGHLPERPHGYQYLTRLLARAADEPPAERVRRIVKDASAALHCSYSEVLFDDLEFVFEPSPMPHAVAAAADARIGRRTLNARQPLVVWDAGADPLPENRAASSLGVRSFVSVPFETGGRQGALTLGWAEQRSQHVMEEEMQFITFLATLISQLMQSAEHERRISELSERIDSDPLTGLRNRAAALEHLAQMVSKGGRTGQRVAVLYIDLNDFKFVNDSYGHAMGDAALIEIARRMTGVLRRHEVPGRIGGDEFAIVVSPFEDYAELKGIAARLLRALAEPLMLDGVKLNISASIGIAVFPDDADTVPELLTAADRAMYAAKRGDKTFSFTKSVKATGTATVTTGEAHFTDFTKTPFDSQFVLCFQPIVAAQTEMPMGAEVLLRWIDPKRGLSLPGAFLQTAASQDRLRDFDELLLAAVSRKSQQISQSVGEMRFFVNVAEPSEQLLDAPAPGASAISLEFPEGRIVAEPERYIPIMNECRQRGYQVGIAGFGSGNLALRHLAQMQLDFVKIDARAVREVRWDRKLSRTWRSIIAQARSLPCTVIAECVETQDEAQFLVQNGAQALQGYAIASPLTEQDFMNWMRYKAAV